MHREVSAVLIGLAVPIFSGEGAAWRNATGDWPVATGIRNEGCLGCRLRSYWLLAPIRGALCVITENLILLAAMVCLIVGPTLIVHLLYRRAEKRRRGEEETSACPCRRRRGRSRDND